MLIVIQFNYFTKFRQYSIILYFALKLRCVYPGNAKLEIEAAYLWLKNVNPAYADQWFRDLMDTIATLQDKPFRCALAREKDDFPQEIRQLIYGKSRNKYRIIFTIIEDMVYILYVRHTSQSSIKFDFLDLE